MATEVGVSAKYAKKVLKRLQRQLEIALGPSQPQLSITAAADHGTRKPAPEKPRESQREQEHKAEKPAVAPPQPPCVPRSRTPGAAGPQQPARGAFLGQQLPSNGPAWGGAAAEAAQYAPDAAGKGPRPPSSRSPAPNGPPPFVSAPPPPPPKLIQREHSWEQPPPPVLLQVPGPSPMQNRQPPPPPPPVQPQVRTPAAVWQQQQPQPHPGAPAGQPGSLYSQPLTARAIPPQHFTGPRPPQAPVQPGSWGSAPGTPVSWQDAQAAAAHRGPFGGPLAGGMGNLQQQHGSALGTAGLRGVPVSTHALQPPPPPGPPRRSTEYAQQGPMRQGSLGRRSLDAAGSLAAAADAAGAFHGNGTPRATVDLGSGSSLFAHPVFPAASIESIGSGASGNSTPHSARAAGNLAFGGKPRDSAVGSFGSTGFGPFPSALPVPEASGALDRMAQQPRRDDLQPAPLQLTQSHFGPTVSANGPQGA